MVLIEVSFGVDVAGAVALGKPSLHQCDERLVFLNDIRGELRPSGVLPRFFTEWTVPAGTSRTSPDFTDNGLRPIRYSRVPSRK
jgi:hypothetical protein